MSNEGEPRQSHNFPRNDWRTQNKQERLRCAVRCRAHTDHSQESSNLLFAHTDHAIGRTEEHALMRGQYAAKPGAEIDKLSFPEKGKASIDVALLDDAVGGGGPPNWEERP
jgi:hypothetical protein